VEKSPKRTIPQTQENQEKEQETKEIMDFVLAVGLVHAIASFPWGGFLRVW